MKRQRAYQQVWLVSGMVLLGLGMNTVSGHAATLTDTTTVPVMATSAKDEQLSQPSVNPARANTSQVMVSDKTQGLTDEKTAMDGVAPSTVTSGHAVSGSRPGDGQPVSTDAAGTVAAHDTPEVTVRQNVVKLVQRAVAQPKARAAELVHVDKDNFSDYFDLNGSASYDSASGVVTLTPDEHDQVGNFSLKSKIDMTTSFSLKGQVNLGSRPSSEGGADGIGFAFHNGNVGDVGNAGGNLDIGGLMSALGFKLDTWHNDAMRPQSGDNGAQIDPTNSNAFGWAADPTNPQFSAFVSTSLKDVEMANGQFAERWWADTEKDSVQDLAAADLDGRFHDFTVTYDGRSRELTIRFTQANQNVLTWRKVVPTSDEALAMIVSASTGGAKNLQQFKLTSFDYQQAATVNVAYVDLAGHRIGQGTVSYPAGAVVGETYTTQQIPIPGYRFVRMDDGRATGKVSLAANGELKVAGDNGDVIYVYAADYRVTQKVVHETIQYVDEQGQSVAPKFTAEPLTFITVDDPTTGESKTYYAQGQQAAPQLTDTGQPIAQGEATWHAAATDDFAAVANPTVSGYTVIANDAPHSDLTEVAAQTVKFGSQDLAFTVVYQPTDSGKPVDPERPIDPERPVTPTTPEQPGTPDEPATTGQVATTEIKHSQRPEPSLMTNATTPFTTKQATAHKGAIVSQLFGERHLTQSTQPLPQTNERSGNWLTSVGAVLLFAVSGFGYFHWRHQR